MQNLKRALSLFGLGTVISLVSFSTLLLLDFSHYDYTWNTEVSALGLLWSVAYTLGIATIEELIFRYLFLRNYLKTGRSIDRVNLVSMALVSSALFGFLHFNPDYFPIHQISLTLSGLTMFLVTYRSKSILPAIGMHFSWNLVQGILFNFSGSGSQLESLLILENEVVLLPEASPYMVLIAMIEFTLIMFFFRKPIQGPKTEG